MLLACKYVDDVCIEAPYIITKDLITSLNITEVINVRSDEDKVSPQHVDVDPYAICKELGIYKEIKGPDDDLTVEKIAERVLVNKAAYELKFEKKKTSETIYYENKKQGMIEN